MAISLAQATFHLPTACPVLSVKSAAPSQAQAIAVLLHANGLYVSHGDILGR